MCKRCIIFMLLFLFIVIGAIFFIWNNANGQSGSVVINEIAWMGTTDNWRYEWFELYNNSNQSVNLTGWELELSRDELDWTLELEGIIEQHSYFLVVSSENIFPNYDLNYSNLGGKFINSGQKVVLKDKNGNSVDEFDARNAWYAGNNSTKETMERKNTQLAGTALANWANGPVGGTPRLANSVWQMANGEEQNNIANNSQNEQMELSEPGNEIPREVLQFTKTNNVIISEFLPNPQGEDADGEWIEIHNTSDESYDLSGWQIDDGEGASSPFTISQGTILAPRGYFVFARTTTKISLTNTGDAVRLLDPDSTVVYEIIYQEKAREGYSYALVDDKWVWTNILTPGSANIQSIQKSASPPLKTKSTNTIVVSEKNESQQNEESKMKTITSNEFSAQLAQKSSFSIPILLIFIAAALLSAASGFGFIFLKNKNNQEQ